MKKCELCNSSMARMYCDSDKASLCWDCDARVHAANFLVAKHSRTLLCHSCQSPTPWTGSGTWLGPTLSVCHICASKDATTTHRDQDQQNDGHNDSEDDDDDDDDDEDEDEGENQVVPFSSSSSKNQAVISEASTSSEGSLSRGFRRRDHGGFSKSGFGFSWRGLH